MRFLFVGFTDECGFRLFTFSSSDLDRSETRFIVKADLSLVRACGIRIQELPLLCRTMLDKQDRQQPAESLFLTEEMLRGHASGRRPVPGKPRAAVPRARIKQEIKVQLEGDERKLDEEIWDAWVLKGKALDRAAARSMKMFAAAALAIAAIGSSVYYLAFK